MDKKIKGAINLVIDIADKNKATADVIANATSSFTLKAEQQTLEEYKVSSSHVFGVRVIQDHKIGTSYCESLNPKALNLMVETALQNTKHSESDPCQEICAESGHVLTDISDIYKPDDTDVKEKIDLCLHLEKAVLDVPYAKSAPYNSVGEQETEKYIANTSGTMCFEKQKVFYCYTSALMEDGDRNGMHYHQSVERTFKALDAETCIKESVDTAKLLMDAEPVATGNYDIIFTTEMLGDLLSAFELVFSAKAAKEGINPWREKIGIQVADKRITIFDKPIYEKGFNYRAFDAEGFLCHDTTLIENGALKTFYHNSATAKHFGVTNNANASRSPKGVLGVGGSQKVIQPGKSKNSSLKNGKYIEIFALQGVHSGADPISGNFSFGASGFLYSNGEVVQAIKGITVSGNFYKLINQIGEIGTDLTTNQSKTFFSPKIRFNDISIAGI